MRKIIPIIIFSLFIIPSLTFASWWNPISWFKADQPAQNLVIVSTSTLAISSTTATTTINAGTSHWWNPFSWRNKNNTSSEESNIIIDEPIVETESTSTLKINTEVKKQDNTADEIESLKREVEALKNQKINTSPVVTSPEVPKPTPPVINTPIATVTSSDGPLKGADRAKYDKLFSDKVTEAEEIIGMYDDAIDDTTDFISAVKSTMRKYPNSSLIQRSGQELIDECNNMISISNMLISILNERKDQFYSHIESDRAPSMATLNEIDSRYNSYYKKYETSDEEIDSLMKEFVLDEKAVLEDKLDQISQDTVPSSNTTSHVLSQSELSQLSSLKTQIDTLQAQYDSACVGVALNFCTGQRAVISEKLNPLIYQYNSILGNN